jgi:hypothetical protein
MKTEIKKVNGLPGERSDPAENACVNNQSLTITDH